MSAIGLKNLNQGIVHVVSHSSLGICFSEKNKYSLKNCRLPEQLNAQNRTALTLSYNIQYITLHILSSWCGIVITV